ncbi:MAG: hypothetical protein JO257_18060 [Deltaproteobacteria bacterium]|nr:hypothetical protein [Deltaproteobacteria bacterium]
MKNLVVLSGLIAAASTGCIISSSSSNNAHVGATWQIKSVVSNQVTGCPSGFDTAALYNQPIDSANNPVGSPIIDLFDCVAGAGTSAALPPTAYMTWVEITTHSNSSVYAKSVPAILDVTDVDLTYNTDIYDDGGYFQFAWNLVGATSGQPLDCASAGVTGASSGVEINATLSGSTAATNDQFNCSDHEDITAGIPAGTYTVSIDAFTSAGAVGTAPTLTNKVINPQNEVTNLGTVNIPITGH